MATPKKTDSVDAANAQVAEVDTTLEQGVDAAGRQVRKDVQQTDADISTLTHLMVRSMGASFRRAGRLWTREVQIVAKALFTDDEVAALKAEPALSVREIAAPQEPAAAPAAGSDSTAHG